jgi:hypothetical protein
MLVPGHILRLSSTLYWTVTALLFALPALVLAALLRDVLDPSDIAARFPEAGIVGLPPRGALLAAGAAGLLPPAAMVYTLAQMRVLFARYAEGEILTPPCADRIRRIGKGLLALAALGLLTRTLQVLILSLGNPEGAHVLAIGIDGTALGFLLSGAFVVVVGRVMHEAVQVAEENRAFV